VIDLNDEVKRVEIENERLTEAINELLSTMWEVDSEKIKIIWEGGAN